jgi:hypothetical protein
MLLQRCLKENEKNLEVVNMKKGHLISLDQEMHIVHLESGYFLNAELLTGSGHGMNIRLKRYPSPSSIFALKATKTTVSTKID